MNIPIYDIEYNQHTGYYNIVDSEGKSYGEYLTYDAAEDAFNNGSFYPDKAEDIDDVKEQELPEGEYVVCREYISHRQHYVMFTRGKLSDHVSYPESAVAYRSGFNDTSIKTYPSMKQAKAIADKFNEISREKGLYKYANWEALMKWW